MFKRTCSNTCMYCLVILHFYLDSYFVERLANELSPSTINNHHKITILLYSYYIPAKIVTINIYNKH